MRKVNLGNTTKKQGREAITMSLVGWGNTRAGGTETKKGKGEGNPGCRPP